MVKKEIINIRQFTTLVILITIGDAILVLPSLIVKHAAYDAWISAIFGLMFGLFIVCLFTYIGKMYPEKSIIQIHEKVLGKWIGSIFSLFFLLYLFFSATIHLREFVDFITTHILETTPIQVITLMFLFIIIYAVRLGLEPLARTAELLFPFIVFSFTLFIILSIPNIDIIQIKPFLGDGLKPIIAGTIPATAFPFMELIVFLMILPNINDQKSVKRNFLIGTFIGGFVLLIIVTLCILVLGIESTTSHIYPSFSLARVIQIGEFVQRIEGVLAIIWTITIYFKITLYVYALHVGLAHLFKLKSYRILTLPLGTIIFASTLIIVPNVSYFLDIIYYDWPLYDITVAIILPLILVLVYKVQSEFKT